MFAEKERPIFYAEEVDLTSFGGCRLVPAGYVHQLLRPGEPPLTVSHDVSPLPPSDPDDFLESHLAGVALYREGTWLAWTGRLDEARDRYAEASQRAWSIPGIVRNCGLGWLELEGYAEAEKLFLRTLELEPKNQDALYDLAVLCANTGRPQDALPYFATLDSLDTGFPEVPLSYASAMLETGHLEDAGRQAEKALKLAPDLESARKLSDAVQRGIKNIWMQPGAESDGGFRHRPGEPAAVAQETQDLARLPAPGRVVHRLGQRRESRTGEGLDLGRE